MQTKLDHNKTATRPRATHKNPTNAHCSIGNETSTPVPHPHPHLTAPTPHSHPHSNKKFSLKKKKPTKGLSLSFFIIKVHAREAMANHPRHHRQSLWTGPPVNPSGALPEGSTLWIRGKERLLSPVTVVTLQPGHLFPKGKNKKNATKERSFSLTIGLQPHISLQPRPFTPMLHIQAANPKLEPTYQLAPKKTSHDKKKGKKKFEKQKRTLRGSAIPKWEKKVSHTLPHPRDTACLYIHGKLQLFLPPPQICMHADNKHAFFSRHTQGLSLRLTISPTLLTTLMSNEDDNNRINNLEEAAKQKRQTADFADDLGSAESPKKLTKPMPRPSRLPGLPEGLVEVVIHDNARLEDPMDLEDASSEPSDLSPPASDEELSSMEEVDELLQEYAAEQEALEIARQRPLPPSPIPEDAPLLEAPRAEAAAPPQEPPALEPLVNLVQDALPQDMAAALRVVPRAGAENPLPPLPLDHPAVVAQEPPARRLAPGLLDALGLEAENPPPAPPLQPLQRDAPFLRAEPPLPPRPLEEWEFPEADPVPQGIAASLTAALDAELVRGGANQEVLEALGNWGLFVDRQATSCQRVFTIPLSGVLPEENTMRALEEAIPNHFNPVGDLARNPSAAFFPLTNHVTVLMSRPVPGYELVEPDEQLISLGPHTFLVQTVWWSPVDTTVVHVQGQAFGFLMDRPPASRMDAAGILLGIPPTCFLGFAVAGGDRGPYATLVTGCIPPDRTGTFWSRLARHPSIQLGRRDVRYALHQLWLEGSTTLHSPSNYNDLFELVPKLIVLVQRSCPPDRAQSFLQACDTMTSARNQGPLIIATRVFPRSGTLLVTRTRALRGALSCFFTILAQVRYLNIRSVHLHRPRPRNQDQRHDANEQ